MKLLREIISNILAITIAVYMAGNLFPDLLLLPRILVKILLNM